MACSDHVLLKLPCKQSQRWINNQHQVLHNVTNRTISLDNYSVCQLHNISTNIETPMLSIYKLAVKLVQSLAC